MFNSFHQDVFHAPCQMLLPTCQFTLDTWRANFRCSTRSKQTQRAKRVNERERGVRVTHIERERAWQPLSLASACGDIVLKFCASNKVISMKLSLFIIALCDCVHREYPTLWGPHRGFYGRLYSILSDTFVYCQLQASERFTICAPPIEISCWNFTISRIKTRPERGLCFLCGDSMPRARTQKITKTKLWDSC